MAQISGATVFALLLVFHGFVGSASAATVPQPTRGLMPNAGLGKTLYEARCASCHGMDLKGSKDGPPFLHAYYIPSHHGDQSFQLAARYGAKAHHWQFGDMKAVPEVGPDEVAHITAYVRAQQRRAGFR